MFVLRGMQFFSFSPCCFIVSSPSPATLPRVQGRSICRAARDGIHFRKHQIAFCLRGIRRQGRASTSRNIYQCALLRKKSPIAMSSTGC
jgi:hypothetical protein